MIRNAKTQRFFLVDGARTPFLKARGGPGPFTPVDLAVQYGRPLLARQELDCAALDLIILGCVNVIADEMNPARVAALQSEFFKPVIGLERGLTDPITELNMGQTAEVLAYRFGIDRETADAYSMESHHRLAAAQKHGTLRDEVMSAIDRDGTVYDLDDGVRPDSDMEGLAKLKPVFEKPYGKVTAGNSSQITDGASWVILASEKAVAMHKLEPLAEIKDSEWAALDPSIMGLGPVLAATPIAQRHGFGVSDIDLWELNEAFAAQVLACLAAWSDHDFYRDVLGFDDAFGRINRDRPNVDGGAISLGHPVGTSGNRIVLHLANAFRVRGAKRGIATECMGGGLGGAMLLEAV